MRGLKGMGASLSLLLVACWVLGIAGSSYGQGAKYVGAETCKKCHSRAYETWTNTAHAKDFSKYDYHGEKIINKYTYANGYCASCHVVGYGEPSGYNPQVPWDQQKKLLKIQCENCHGPGEAHAEATSPEKRRATMNRLPDAKLTCQKCHVSRYLKLPTGAATDENLKETPRRQSAMLYGVHGFEYPGVMYISSMHKAVVGEVCVTCHMNPGNWHDLKADLESCQRCHGGETDFNINGRQTEIASKLKTLKARLDAFKKKHATVKVDPKTHKEVVKWDTKENGKAYLRALYNHKFVDNDGSRGVHNYKYAKGLLDASLENLPED